jgi:hypothetical protein
MCTLKTPAAKVEGKPCIPASHVRGSGLSRCARWPQHVDGTPVVDHLADEPRHVIDPVATAKNVPYGSVEVDEKRLPCFAEQVLGRLMDLIPGKPAGPQFRHG